jgi:hypothetical protein
LSPWVGRDALDLHGEVTLVVRNRREAIGQLSTMLDEMGATPPVMRPPADHGSAHYLTVEYLLPRLVGDLRQVVEAYQSSDPRGVSAALERLLSVATNDLERLERLLEGRQSEGDEQISEESA